MNRKIILAAVITGLMFLLSCSNESDEVSGATYTGREDLAPLPVEALTVSRGKLITTVNGSGIIRGANEAWSISETAGIITQVYVSPGAYVNSGDPLLKVDENLAYWDMKRSEQQLETAAFEYKGAKDSFERGAISQVEYNRTYTSWFNSRFSYEMALKAYNDCTLRAPLSGYVSQMDTTLTPGNTLKRGTAVLKVVEMDEFVLEISPGQKEVGLIHRDYPASVYIDLADKTIVAEGRVLDISGGSNEKTGSFPVRIIWKNNFDYPVLPGMTARVEVATNEALEGIIIPMDRILEREGKKWVYLAKDGVVTPREVVPGARLGNRVMIEKGLDIGEILISSGFSSLAPGYPVILTVVGESGGW